jgi:hypothetical protein
LRKQADEIVDMVEKILEVLEAMIVVTAPHLL